MSNQKEIFLCAISNIQSGDCSEDCHFCAQSTKYKTNISRYKSKDISQIIKEAHMAKKNSAQGFCLVTSGKNITDSKLEYLLSVIWALKKENLGLRLNACCGLATLEQLKELKCAGIEVYNHNLESSKEYYPSLCSTHTWGQRYQTCLHVKEAGLSLACGGIFGIGESPEDRESLFHSIKSLKPTNSPVKFLSLHTKPAYKI